MKIKPKFEIKNDESSTIKEKQVFITGLALLSMEFASGARLMGVQRKTVK